MTPARPAPRRLQVAAALLAVWVLWGSTYLGIRVVVRAAPALLTAGVRFTLAGTVLLAAVAWGSRGRGGIGPRLRGRTGRFATLGVLHFLVANGLVSIAEQHLASAAAGVCFATVPLWLLVVRWLTGRRPAATDLLVVVTGLAGVALLLGLQRGPLLPSLQVLAAAAVWAAAGHLAGRPDSSTAPPAGTALSAAVQMIAGGLALLAVSAGRGEWGRVHPDTFGPAFWLAGGHLVLLGSLVGFWAYTWLVARVDQRLASTYAYVNPAIAVLLGWLLLGEHLTRGALAGTALVTGAVAWTVLSQSRTGAAQPAELRTTSVGTTPLRSTPVRSTPVRSTRPERTKATT